MKIARLGDIDFYSLGTEYQLAGTILSGKGRAFILTLPEKQEDFSNLELMPLTLDEWEILLKQFDEVETEIFAKDPTGKVVKVLARKSQRQIDSYLQWKVFRRDNYHCRYCGRTGIPLTVDHVDLWEDGGPPIEMNLITACHQCNKDRGRMKYEEWLYSPTYQRKAVNLAQDIKQLNESVLGGLDRIRAQRYTHIRSR